MVLGAAVDPSGHRVPQRRIQAQCALRAPWLAYKQTLGLRRTYSASQRLIFGTGARQRTSWQLSATRRRSGVEFGVN